MYIQIYDLAIATPMCPILKVKLSLILSAKCLYVAAVSTPSHSKCKVTHMGGAKKHFLGIELPVTNHLACSQKPCYYVNIRASRKKYSFDIHSPNEFGRHQ